MRFGRVARKPSPILYFAVDRGMQPKPAAPLASSDYHAAQLCHNPLRPDVATEGRMAGGLNA